MEMDTAGWLTDTTEYKGYSLVMKSKRNQGIKCHCIKEGKEVFTQRFSFITPEKLLDKMRIRIDKIISGEYVPHQK